MLFDGVESIRFMSCFCLVSQMMNEKNGGDSMPATGLLLWSRELSWTLMVAQHKSAHACKSLPFMCEVVIEVDKLRPHWKWLSIATIRSGLLVLKLWSAVWSAAFRWRSSTFWVSSRGRKITGLLSHSKAQRWLYLKYSRSRKTIDDFRSGNSFKISLVDLVFRRIFKKTKTIHTRQHYFG